ncbi:invasion protein IalB [Rhodovulum iodosum]|uniref:Invasion protein IalB n=1 Tax=Rhodovulum iodosum TaxID=68291 RepID=A0ABV3XVR2_9RHOB|nr:invasion associated locus B family protein [Rhodovulum robiginosum]RSK32300.1 invasion associated locus B family protein [Rhodovulum robiginosum]
MRDLIKSLTCIAALALAAPALAQDTSDAAPQDTPEPQTATEEAAAPKVGETYVRDTHGDWQLRCARAPEGQTDPCQLYQLLSDEQGNSVAEISIFPLPDGANGQAVAGATIVTPLETLLTEQLRVNVDDGEAKVYPFSWCNQVGCFARIGFTAEDVASFKRGAEAALRIVPVAAPDQQVVLRVSLSGFTAGFDALAAEQ